VIFLIFVLSLSSYIKAQEAFSTIKTALANFRDSIIKEQLDADARNKKEVKWCNDVISKAQKVLDDRTKDVNDVTDHIKYLQNEIKETTNDMSSKQNRIKENNSTLHRFKKERCENNLHYIKTLREHKDTIDILKLLRKDIDDYFTNWLKNPQGGSETAKAPAGGHGPVVTSTIELPAFIEKLSRFAHLFDDEHRQIFIQLIKDVRLIQRGEVADLTAKTDDYTKVADRTVQEIGTGHVDNTKGELQKLETPGFVKARDYVLQLRTKVLGMIDNLIKHLNDSRKKLSEDEMLANEHFADFQSQMIKENKYLRQKIVEDQKHLVRLGVHLKKAQDQYTRREALREEAEETLKALQKKCNEKADYYARETKRRNGENVTAQKAMDKFNEIFNKISARTLQRTSSGFQGQTYAKTDLSAHNVVDYRSTADSSVDTGVKSRNQVVF